MKRAALLILFGLLLVGCTTTTPAADPTLVDSEPSPEMTGDEASVQPTVVAEPAVPTSSPETAPMATADDAPAETESETAADPAEPEPAATEIIDQPQETASPTGMNGRNDDGTFYRGAADAPVTIIEYSDFLWTTCRAHVLGAGKQIVDTYVASGEVKVVFWPITDFGQTSIDAAASAYCVGQQEVDAYWRFHDLLFEQYNETYGGDRDYFIEAAVASGAAQAAFEACYDSGEGHTVVTNLNQMRLDRGINRRPTFDVNGNLLFGAPPLATFDQLIQASLPG